MNVIFFGTPEFVIPVADGLLRAPGYQLVAVITNPDRPVGRQQILTPSPLKKWGLKHKIPVLTPEKLDPQFLNFLISQYPNIPLGILAAYGKIIPQDLIDLFPKGILVVHPSLLPKYRGASPVQAAIMNGDKETGVTIIKMDEKIDHGPIISQFSQPIKEDDTTGTLRTRLFAKAAEVLVTILPAYLEGRITLREQNHEAATFTKVLKKEDGKIDWSWPDNKIERFIRAMDPWPGAWTTIQITDDKRQKIEKRLKILKAHLEDIRVNSWAAQEESPPKSKKKRALPIRVNSGEAGKVKKCLVLDLVQLEGKNPVSFPEFQRGYPDSRLI